MAVRFIAVRGSGEPHDTSGSYAYAGNTAKALYNDVTKYAPSGITTALHGVDYAAVGMDFNGIGDMLKTINPIRYESSKSGGARNLQTYVNSQASCLAQGEKWVFIGFSQGAHVIGDSFSAGDGFMSASQLSSTAAVVLIADPRFNSQEPFDAGTFVRGRNGVAGARSPGDLRSVSSKVKSWCDTHDPVCQGLKGQKKGVHCGTCYESNYKDAMVSFLRNKLGWLPTDSTSGGYSGNIDVALAIDTTGSMGPYIDSVKASSIDLFNQLAHSGANARMAVVDYKDAEYDPYAAQIDTQFTSDATTFQSAVEGLGASGGGDTPEYVLSGVQTAINDLSWRAGAKKIIIPIGDAPGKDPEPVGGLTSAQVLQDAYNLDPAQVYPISLSSDADTFMQALADGSAGTLFDASDPSTIVGVLTEALLTAVDSPVAVLSPVDPVAPGATVTLSAAASFDPDPTKTITSYRWDFDGDGTIDLTTATPFADHLYASPFTGTAAVTVTNDSGTSSIASTPIIVTDDTSMVPNATPGAVSDLRATGSTDSITLNWTPPSGTFDGYDIALTSTSDGSTYELAWAGPEDTSLELDGIDAGTYSASVAAFNVVGDGPDATAVVTVGATTPPPSADGVTVVFKDAKGKTTQVQGDIVKGDIRIYPRTTARLRSVTGVATLSDTASTKVGIHAHRVTLHGKASWHGHLVVRGGQTTLAGVPSAVVRSSATQVVLTGKGKVIVRSGHRSITRSGTFTMTVNDVRNG